MPEPIAIVSEAIHRLLAMPMPKDFPGKLMAVCNDWDVTPSVDIACVEGLLADPARKHAQAFNNLHIAFAKWDGEKELEWAKGNHPRFSKERRQAVYEALSLPPSLQEVIDKDWPIEPRDIGPRPITRVVGDDWYEKSVTLQANYYWNKYKEYLHGKNWTAENIAALDKATDDVVSQLKAPSAPEPKPVKGLVVGYVQSGKTANFTGVIAKAIDAGYRLIIVLAGIHNELRNQTQRRLDKELVGREIIKDAEHGCDYENDPDWVKNEFVSHDGKPRDHGAPNIERLTTAKRDFLKAVGTKNRFLFEKINAALPFWTPENSSTHAVKLVVLKKNGAPLKKLKEVLQAAAANGTAWQEVPSLIIDDESDQASLHAGKAAPETREDRRVINGLLLDIIGVLIRPSYVGYTATPVANVFVDPDDAVDIFPSDFIISLPRPIGYMGIRDFYDDEAEFDYLEDGRDEKGHRRLGHPDTNFGAHVRPIFRTAKLDDDDENLPMAVDSFVLAGAIKLYRQDKTGGELKFKHHTMLIHCSTRKHEHIELRDKLRTWFASEAYPDGGSRAFKIRLDRLWHKDFQPVCKALAGKGWPVPEKFAELAPFIDKCLQKIRETIGEPGKGIAIALNSDKLSDEVNFEKQPVWKIVVGGSKLSRGYTVEDLTVTYFRRVANYRDTLMQMGRWFGYRHGYKDLVRLFIGVEEAKGNTGAITADLYQDFKEVFLDEEEFRAQLKRYARLEGEQRLTPQQVPPLVPQHILDDGARHRTLVTAKNRMFNARPVFINYGGDLKQTGRRPGGKEGKQHNETLMRALWADCNSFTVLSDDSCEVLEQKSEFENVWKKVKARAYVGSVAPEKMLAFLDQFELSDPGANEKGKSIKPDKYDVIQREFLGKQHGDPCIDRWLIVAPQFEDEPAEEKTWIARGNKFGIRRRAKVTNAQFNQFKVFTEPDHVRLAHALANNWAIREVSPTFRQLVSAKQGVMLFYPVKSPDEEQVKGGIPSMGFALIYPSNNIPMQIRWSVKDPSRPDEVVVDRPKTEDG
jgi:hypothetical protein